MMNWVKENMNVEVEEEDVMSYRGWRDNTITPSPAGSVATMKWRKFFCMTTTRTETMTLNAKLQALCLNKKKNSLLSFWYADAEFSSVKFIRRDDTAERSKCNKNTFNMKREISITKKFRCESTFAKVRVEEK